MKYTYLLLTLLFVTIFSNCSKELLDLTSDDYYSVKTFLKSKNTDTVCGTEASCEGKTVKLKGIIDIDNINKESRYFRLMDQNDSDFSMQITVTEPISMEVFDNVVSFGSKVIVVEGVIKGFDAHMNISCDRLFTMTISDSSKIKLL